MGSFMSPARSTSTLPTDAEIEADAERERERSMREAERIMARERLEAENRMTVEERVMAMLQNEGGGSEPIPIPPRRQSQPLTPHTPSPTTSQKEKSGWWTATKTKLTPTKEPLTPAQQVVHETKVREKEKQKEKKSAVKGKSKEWPASPERKFSDPAYANLALPAGTSAPRGISASPSSSSPVRYSNPSSLNPTPNPSPSRPAESPSKGNAPLYAQFDSDGVLDVASTLLTVAKRFEKLEKWTVGHVRALEDRMDDVERWLVEKEQEKESQSVKSKGNAEASTQALDVSDIREELSELQGRMGEIGREMAKMVTSPGNLSSGPSRSSTSLNRAPSAVSSMAVRTMTTSPPHTYSTHSKEATSPPAAAPLVQVLTGSRTRLPYPSGDYATPPSTVSVAQGHFSPPSSPPSSSKPYYFSGLPSGLEAPSSSVSGLPRSTSPANGLVSPSPSSSLPAPKRSPRPSSVSPTPRKRYTVALGGRVMSPEPSPQPTEPQQLSTAFFSSAGEDSADEYQDETVGKSAGRRSEFNSISRNNNNSSSHSHSDSASSYSYSDREPRHRPRPQSTYGGPAPSVAPLQPRLRSRSIVGLGISEGSGKFIDPLVLRRQEKERSAAANKKGKKAVGDLVAFFDNGEK